MWEELKREVCRENRRLPEYGLVVLTWGNVSARTPDGHVIIKPSGVDYAAMTPEQMVVTDLDGHIVEGELRPSSDLATHLEIYRSFPEVGGVVHTHSRFAASLAQAERDLPCYGTTHADHLAADIPCTEFMPDERIANDYETETGLQIVECFRKKHLNPDEIPMALVAGHGPFTWGTTAAKALYNAKVLEELCRMALVTEQVNPAAARLKEALIEKHYNRKHGKNAYYGQK